MGVSESLRGAEFEKETNLRDFVIEEKERERATPLVELHHEAEKIVLNNWERLMREEKEGHFGGGGTSSSDGRMMYRADLQTLRPEVIRPKESFYYNEEFEREQSMHLLRRFVDGNDGDFLTFAPALILLYPEETTRSGLNDKRVWKSFSETQKGIRQKCDTEKHLWHKFFLRGADAKIIFNNIEKKDLLLDQEARQKAKEWVKQYGEREDITAADFAELLKNIGILFPGLAAGCLDSKMIEKLRGGLIDANRNNDLQRVVYTAAALKIAAAQEIKIDKNGITCVIPEGRERVKDKPRPERKKF